MNNTLKLQIETALDNAGIKATKEQIDGLAESIGKVNKQGANTNLGSVTKIQGPLGKLQDMFGKIDSQIAMIGSRAMAVIGSFKVGWDIGSFVYDKIIQPLTGWGNKLSELQKENRKLKKEYDAAMAAYEMRAEKSAAMTENELAGIERETKKIDGMRQAWMNVLRAKSEYVNSSADLEIQKLERERLEDVMKLQAEGDFEGAEQANRLYDFYRKQIEAKKEIEAFDREALALERENADIEEKRDRLYEKLEKHNARLLTLAKERNWIEDNAPTAKDYDRMMAANERKQKRAEAARDAVQDEIDTFEESAQAQQIKVAAMRNKRAILLDRTNTEIDRAAFAYDSHVAENGNALGFEFTKEFTDALAEQSRESYDGLIKAISEGIANGVGQLMEAKQ